MRRVRLTQFILIITAVALVLAMTSCSSQDNGTSPPSQSTPESAPATEALPEAATDAPIEVATTASADILSEAQGVDLSAVNVCELLPVAEIEAVIGKLRDTSPEETISIDREKGCNYLDDANGHFYEITYYPLDHWGLVKYTLNEAKPAEGIGDGAYWGTYSDAIMLEVLAKDRAVIGVRVSDENQDTARALYEIALNHLP